MIGQFAVSKAGHDKTGLYVIIGEDGDFVYLCDGRLKPLSSPKKKRMKHIQIINVAVEEDLKNRLLAKQTVRDEEIKYAIKKYIKKD